MDRARTAASPARTAHGGWHASTYSHGATAKLNHGRRHKQSSVDVDLHERGDGEEQGSITLKSAGESDLVAACQGKDAADAVVLYREVVVPLARLERAAYGLGNRCSIHLSYRGID